MEGGELIVSGSAELRRAGVTDYEVAKRTGVSTVTLTNWKYGMVDNSI